LLSCSQEGAAGERGSLGERALPGETVVCADNLGYMRSLPDGFCHVIYADPPFSSCGAAWRPPRSNGIAAEPPPRSDEYLGLMVPRLVEMRRLLADRGSLFLHLDWRRVHYVKVELDGIFGENNFLNELIWAYRSGGRPAPWFARQHDTILWYAKQAGGHTFNRLRCGEYRTRDLCVAKDGRPYKSTRKGPIYFDPGGPALADVWDIPILSTVARERTGYPSQKPERLLERIILASSHEGDLVADFFCGSGTTLVVAKRLKRRWLGADISAEAQRVALGRIANTIPSG